MFCTGFLEFLLNLVQFQGHSLVLDCLPFNLQLLDLAVQLGYRLRHGVHLQTQFGCRLVHQVYGLVRQETGGDVPV